MYKHTILTSRKRVCIADAENQKKSKGIVPRGGKWPIVITKAFTLYLEVSHKNSTKFAIFCIVYPLFHVAERLLGVLSRGRVDVSREEGFRIVLSRT